MTPFRFNDAWTGPDKLQHVIGGAAISIVTATFFGMYFGFNIGLAAGFLVGAGIGASKEVWDMYHPPHDPTFQDFCATSAGSLLGIVIILLGQL
jgi:VanZ family protein